MLSQATIPKEIRDSLGLQPQVKLNFSLLSDDTVIMRANKRGIKPIGQPLAKKKATAMIGLDTNVLVLYVFRNHAQ
jgi:bifunctional DNA-binding transcriptional regulator/antitoxin component of YhaV-PrlF toxin-antitoxin module